MYSCIQATVVGMAYNVSLKVFLAANIVLKTLELLELT